MTEHVYRKSQSVYREKEYSCFYLNTWILLLRITQILMDSVPDNIGIGYTDPDPETWYQNWSFLLGIRILEPGAVKRIIIQSIRIRILEP